jgi:hypothetical protein
MMRRHTSNEQQQTTKSSKPCEGAGTCHWERLPPTVNAPFPEKILFSDS